MKTQVRPNNHPSKVGRLALWLAGAAIAWLSQGAAMAAISQVRLVSPANQAIDFSPCATLTWEKASGATGYEYEIKIGTTVYSSGGSGGATDLSLTLPENTTFSWRVRGRTSANNGAWSSTRTFTTKVPIPAPILTVPAGGQNFAGADVVLQWNPAASSTSYDYEVYQNSSLVVSGTAGGGSSPDTSVHVSNGIFQWRIRGKTSCRVGTWSAFRSFCAGLPATPTLVSPQNNSQVAGPNISLNWQTVANATTYNYVVLQNGAVLQSGSGNPPVTVNLPVKGNYQWQVRAVSPAGVSDWAEPWGFSTFTPEFFVNAGPDIVVPNKNYTNVSATAMVANTPAPTSWVWEKVSGPGVVYSQDFFSPTFDFRVTAKGSYVLKVTASNGQMTRSDTNIVTFLETVFLVDAGKDQSFPFPWTGNLVGSGLVDGRPDPVVSLRWRQTGGPGSLYFSAPTSPVTDVTPSAPGRYTIVLDGWYQGNLYRGDGVTITFGPQTGGSTAFATIDSEDSRPYLEASKGLNGAFKLTVLSRNDRPCSVQRTDNLAGWADWQTIYPTNGMATIVDTDVASPQRFYRLKVQ